MELPSITVSHLNTYVKKLFDEDLFFASVIVSGEISNFSPHYKTGHLYFSLKDEQSAVKAVMFAGQARRLRFRPENGMKVFAVGRVGVFERDGVYQLYVNDMLPDGEGALAAAFRQRKERLEAQGLFDEAHKKPLPAYPARIAVITSSAGAAVHDMIRILSRRWPMSKVLLLPVRVQGVEAPPEIVGAIHYANRHALADLIITGRGGGSIEDLWAFNDERVARAIYDSEIPVISAVGHEPDVTIADYVADKRASTPSNAAEIAVPDASEERQMLASYSLRAAQAMDRRLRQMRSDLENLRSRRVLRDAGAYLDDRRVELDRLREDLGSAMENVLERKRSEELRLAAALDAMSPLRVLTRGYAVASDEEGTILTSVKTLRKGSRLRLRLSDGVAACAVESINEENEP